MSLHQTVRDALPIRLGDRKYNIDVTRLQRATVDPIRQGFDTQGTPGEQSLNQAGVWKRSRNNWELGTGQREADTLQSEARRFYTSTGINPWTENEIKLLPDVVTHTNMNDTSSTNQYLAQAKSGATTYVYWVRGDNVYYNADIATTTWTAWTETAVGSGAVIDIASDGRYAYVAMLNAIYRINGTAVGGDTLNGANPYWTVAGIDGVWVANGYLIASAATRLTVAQFGSATLTDITPTSFDQVQEWKSVISSPVGIFAAGNKGNQARIFYIGINDSTTSLLPPVISAELPEGETVNALSYYGGVICIATSRGIRLATISGQGYLNYGPVIEISGGVSYLEGQGEFIWFNWNNYDSPFDSTARTGLGRLGLTEFTGNLVAAYASDLMYASANDVQGIITTSDNRRLFSIKNVGLKLENTDSAAKVGTGTIDEGRFRWGITELKAAVSTDLRHDPLPAGSTIAVSLVDDADATTAVVTSSTALSTSPGLTAVTGAIGEHLSPQITLTNGTDTSKSPVVKRWTVRAIPMPYVSEVVALPIILTTQTRYDERDVYQDTFSDYDYLRSLMESRALVTFTMGSEAKTVYVAGVSYEAGSITKWSDHGNWFEGVLTVQIVTVQDS